jgi:hypothetical protein
VGNAHPTDAPPLRWISREMTTAAIRRAEQRDYSSFIDPKRPEQLFIHRKKPVNRKWQLLILVPQKIPIFIVLQSIWNQVWCCSFQSEAGFTQK